MPDELRVLVCVDGTPASELLAGALPLVATRARWQAVHVIDTRGRVDLGLLRAGVPAAGPLPPHLVAAIEEAGGEHANMVLAAASAALLEHGLPSESGVVRVGEPGREICATALAVRASLVVLRASRQLNPRPGPHSVGHTARFVIDHAPCPVLVIRAELRPSRLIHR